MAITLKTEIDVFLREPIESYTEVIINEKGQMNHSPIFIFNFKLRMLHPDDEVIIIPQFRNKEDIAKFAGFVSREGKEINVSLDFEQIYITTKFDVYIKKTSEESIKIFKEGETNKNAEIEII